MRYDALVSRKVIPDLALMVGKVSSKRYPKFVVDSKKYGLFGMFMEYVLKKCYVVMVSAKQDITRETFQSFIIQSNKEAARDLGEKPFFESSLVDPKFLTWLRGICDNMVLLWDSNSYGTNFRYDVVFSRGMIEGHPDIVGDRIIWDVKCGCTNKSTLKESCLQILSYWALSDDPAINYIGLILPLAGKHALFDMSGWKKDILRRELENVSQAMRRQESITQFVNQNIEYQFPVGHHIANEGLLSSIKNWIEYCFDKYGEVRPAQIYLQASRGTKDDKITVKTFVSDSLRQNPKTIGDIPEVSGLISNFGLKLFVHTPHCMNISSHGNDYVSKIIRQDLTQLASLGGKGVVVHTGKSMTETIAQALTRQAEIVRECLPSATESCKLLLETPCGKGTEICTTLDDFNGFFLHFFTEEERKKLGVCLDTCHIFVSGESPYEYIKYWVGNCCVKVGLVHFNDAKNYFGNCKDGHAYPGHGKIGYDEMLRIAEFCSTHDIPMVNE
jgi:endonuclease IV